MKQEPPNPSPIKPFLGLHEGRLRWFVSAFPLSLLGPRHEREGAVPAVDERDAAESLRRMERYLEK
jgi:hypothetical protein